MASFQPTSTRYTVKVELLSPLVDENVLRLATGKSGYISSVKINKTQNAFNFACVNYSQMEDAEEAVRMLNGENLLG